MHGHHHAPPTHDDGTHRPWSVLALLCIAQFMVILDITVVNVALPSIQSSLGFDGEDLQWVVTAYVLMTGGFLMLGGRVADLAGRRDVFLAGLLAFTGASLASGLATSPETLIAARAAQGLGAALLSPAALSIITTTYSGTQRTRALSAWGAIAGGGAAAGVLLGGMLTSWLSWEWIFFINVPIGLAAAVASLHLLPRDRRAGASLRHLDLPGALTLVPGLVLLVYAIEGAARNGWGSARTLALLAVAAGLLGAFALVERRAGEPLVPVATWRVRSLVSSAAVMLGATGILVGTFFLNSLLLQNVLDASALETGLAFLPLVGVTGIAAHLGPHLLARFGARAVVVAGLTLVTAANLLLAGVPARADYATDLLPGFLLLGFGVGLAFVAVSVTAMADVGHERAGLASGLMTSAHEVGGAFGVAVFSAVALGAAHPVGTAFVDGYGEGAIAGAVIAAAMAALALVALPAARPAAGVRVALH